MSRIGNKIITVPEGVTVEIADDNTVTVTGSKGTLVKQFSPVISFKQEGNEITVVRSSEEKHVKQLHGTTRALLANMIEGVHNGYSKTLEIVGIGYRGQMKGNTLVLNIGFSHQVEIEAEEGVKVETPNPNTIVVSGIDKERVGQMAALIRSKKKPEPYKGKGIKYADEVIRRKVGKKGAIFMAKLQSRNDVRLKRHARVRRKISGTPECPRLNVFRSNAHIHAQIIDDVNGVTLVSASSVEMKLENGGNIAAATAVGKEIAERAIAKEIKNVVFDRGGYIYHGRVKALAEAAREAGLEF